MYRCLTPASSIKFETGNDGVTNSSECSYKHRLLDSCPIARGLGEVVSNGRPFIWMPGELQLRVKCTGRKLIGDRIEESVPIFRESVQVPESVPWPCRPLHLLRHRRLRQGGHEVAVPSDADLEDAAEEPMDRMQRLVKDAQSLEHMICQFPKNQACPICNQSRMYRKKVRKLRLDPLRHKGVGASHTIWRTHFHRFHHRPKAGFRSRKHSASYQR